jgi:hypothetical protein
LEVQFVEFGLWRTPALKSQHISFRFFGYHTSPEPWLFSRYQNLTLSFEIDPKCKGESVMELTELYN